jgi:hypothetical protein
VPFSPNPPDRLFASNLRLTVVNAGSFGFSLTPGASNKGGYPVTVIIDEDEQAPVTISNSDVHWHTGQFTKLEVRGSSERHAEGDTWKVELARSHSHGRNVTVRCDRDGYVYVRQAPTRTLFELDSRKNGNWSLLSNEHAFFYVNPDPWQRQWEFARGDFWSLSGYRNVAFTFEQYAEGVPAQTYTLSPWVSLGSSPGGFELLTISMGSSPNFGTTPTTSSGHILLRDTITASSGGKYNRQPLYFPYIRFYLAMTGFVPPALLADTEKFWMRATAIAW